MSGADFDQGFQRAVRDKRYGQLECFYLGHLESHQTPSYREGYARGLAEVAYIEAANGSPAGSCVSTPVSRHLSYCDPKDCPNRRRGTSDGRARRGVAVNKRSIAIRHYPARDVNRGLPA